MDFTGFVTRFQVATKGLLSVLLKASPNSLRELSSWSVARAWISATRVRSIASPRAWNSPKSEVIE